MAISSVELLVDYRDKVKNPIASLNTSVGGLNTRVTALENAGGVQSLALIADEYDPNRNEYYPNNDMVVNDEKLYKSNTAIYPMIGEFDEDMWSEIPEYDSTQTYEGTAKVVHEGTPYRKNPMVPGVTGEWNSSYWIEITPTAMENYDETATTPPQALEIENSFYATNSSYEPTGGVGEFDSTKWVETTVEQVINAVETNINSRIPRIGIHQLCTSANIRTDANGYVTNTLSYPTGAYTPLIYRYVTTTSIIGTTCMVQVEHGCISGNNQTRLRLVDASGQPLANITEGISDMAILQLTYINISV